MPKDFKRTDRVAQVIQRELALMFQMGINDPRLSPLLTISAVEVTRDLAHAKVYIMMPETDEVAADNIKILNEDASRLRYELAARIKLRSTPRLRFIHDVSLNYANKMTKLIDEAISNIPEDNED